MKEDRDETGPKSTNPAKAAGADPIDWEAMLREHRPWIRSVIAARVGEAHAIDEVLQEVALGAVKGAPADLPHEKVGPWLYQVAVRQSLMYRRSAGRRRKLVDGFVEKVQPMDNSREADPLDWLVAEEQATKIQQAMAALHRRDREILMLKYDQGWSYHDIVEHLGISHSAVEARLHRARNRLRKELVRRDVMTENTKSR
ncbi:MAG: sigma-70 family RNA polymerase sigma factor [Planctomycetota bacterium]